MELQNSLVSISQYIELLNEQLGLIDVRILGEVTQVKIWSSGHVYFTLKDTENGAVLDCVIWKGRYALFGITLKLGMEIVATGHANIYAPTGRLSFLAQSLELVGEGALKKAYDALKKKLHHEGIFAQERKRSIPKFPQRIGIITSQQGAVIHDFMNNLGQHGFQITFINSKVEGIEALPDLYHALKTLKKKDLDVIVLMRGGGSIQSLAAFDAEALVREIATSRVPVIAALGHHQDVPLSALAADMMVSTPTAAATLLNKSFESALQIAQNDYQKIMYRFQQALFETEKNLLVKREKILDKFNRIILTFSYITTHMPKFISQIAHSLESKTKEFTRATHEIITAMDSVIKEKEREIHAVGGERIVRSYAIVIDGMHEKIAGKERLISAYNPLRQLSLGYSLIKDDSNKLVKSIKDVTIGEMLSLMTRDGIISSQVTSAEKKNHDETS